MRYEETDRRHGARGVTDQITRMIRALSTGKFEGSALEAIGIGSIGPLDLSRGEFSIKIPVELLKTLKV